MAIKQTFTTDIAQLEKAMAKLDRMNTRLIEQNRKLAAGSQRASRKASSGFGRWVSGLAGVAAGYMSVRSAIQLVILEIQNKEERERGAKNFAITVADAQADAIGNLGNVSGKALDDFNKRMKKLADETKVKGGLATIYQAASTGLSSSGADVDLTERAVRTAAKISPQSAEGIDRLTQAILHLNKTTGTRDAEKNMGFLIGIQSQSAVTDRAKIAQHVIPGVQGVSKYGGTATEAGAIVATITQYMTDREGRKSATAATALAEQLAAFLPEETTYKYAKDRRGRTEKVVDVEGTGLKSPMERIEYMQEHPDARTQFLGGASFSRLAKAPIKMLLGEMELGEAEPLEKYLDALPKPEDYANLFRQTADNMQRPYEQKIAGGQRGIDATIEQLQGGIAGKQDQLAGLYSKENMNKVLQASGSSWSSQFGASRYMEFGGGDEAFRYKMQLGLRQGKLQKGDIADQEQASFIGQHLEEVQAREDALKAAIEKMTDTLSKKLDDQTAAIQTGNKAPLPPAAVGANLEQHGETGAL